MALRPVALVFLLAVFGVAGCGEAYRYVNSGPVGWALKREVRDSAAQRIVLAQLTRFSWDELFLFGPYSPQSEVCKALKLTASQCEGPIAARIDEGSVLLAFRKEGELVHTEHHFRAHGDFTPVPATQPIASGRAIFRVVPDGTTASGGTWLTLVLE